MSFSSIMTYVTCGAGPANPSGAHEFTPVFSGVCVVRSLVFCVIFVYIIVCHFVRFRLVTVLFVFLRFMTSNCPFGIFKLFLGNKSRSYHCIHQIYENVVT